MPTRRAGLFLILAIVLYFLANQTQVGWLYLIVDGIIALMVVAFFYGWGMLKPLQARRTLQNMSPDSHRSAQGRQKRRAANGTLDQDAELILPTFYEDDPVEVTLHFNHSGLRPALLVGGRESCPFAPPADRDRPFFMPALFKGESVTLSYQTHCHRRGLYRFSETPLHSKGPFGLFRFHRTLPLPGEILIYPGYYALKRLRLLESRGLADRQARRVGPGSEVLGTREYRAGDSLRQIHWRSTAKTGKLVVKEFADQDQPTLTMVLDLEQEQQPDRGKYSPFETALRLAASFSYYAGHKSIPFYLAGASRNWKPPASPLSWQASLNYLARVENDGDQPLDQVLGKLPARPFVVVPVSKPDEAVAGALMALSRQGTRVLTFFISPGNEAAPLAPALKAAGVEVRDVEPHQWQEALVDL